VRSVTVELNQFLSGRTLRNLDNVVQVNNLTTGEDVSEGDVGGVISFQSVLQNGQLRGYANR
jgi:hypothetical protein